MLFPTLAFLGFFLVVAALSAALDKHFLVKKLMLTIASFYFYAQWNWRFCFLLAGSTAVSYIAGLLIAGTENQRKRRLTVGLAVTAHLLLLSFFKYRDFVETQVNTGFAALGIGAELPFADIVLPIGISFFTFHGISYVVDVYRRDVEVCRRPVDMALYMSFFPQLVSGPIVRAAYFLPQLAKPSGDRVPLSASLVLILFGLFKKMVMADYLAANLVDPVFAAPTSFGGADLALATYGYAVQIYCDFSGYTDMAIGVAELLGFRFPLALPIAEPAGILAALAYLAQQLAARLSLQAAGRQPAWSGADLSKPDRHHVVGRHLAWRAVEVRDLGRAAWRRACG